MTDFLENQANLFPHHHDVYSTFADLYERRLWHQLTNELLAFVSDPANVDGDNLHSLYTEFISKLASNLKPIRYAQIVSKCAHSLVEPSDRKSFLNDALNSSTKLSEDAIFFLDVEIALADLALEVGEEVGSLLPLFEQRLNAMTTEDTVIAARFYFLSLEYYRKMGPPEDFYRASLLFLSYTNAKEALSEEDQFGLACDLAVSALSSIRIFNFGEVMQSDILSALEGTEFGFLKSMVEAFYHGSVTEFHALLDDHRDAFDSLPALVENLDTIKEKICLLSLLQLIFTKPPHQRVLSFQEIQEHLSLEQEEEVEWIVMRALFLGLIRGTIDEVEQRVSVSYIQPQVLDLADLGRLAEKLGTWGEKVKGLQIFMEEQVPELTF
jgi:26S proteasome regulatory subunit N9